MAQLYRQTCALNCVHSTIPPNHCVLIFAHLSVITQTANLIPKLGVIRDHGTSFAERTEVLSRIKTKTADLAHRPCFLALVFGPMGLGSIFHNKQAVLPREFQNWIHVRYLAKEMDGNNS